MGDIICAIRGGPASQSTIYRAIELAKRTQQPLTFLYVINLNFLSRTMKSRTTSIKEDLRQMGETILLMALETAVARGINAQKVVEEGDVAEQILALCRELDAEYVVVGEPIRLQKTAVFTSQKVETLGSDLKKSCQAELIIVE